MKIFPRVQIRVGCAPDIALQRLQAFLGALYGGGGVTGAEVVHLRSGEQLRLLGSGELDLALIHDCGPGPEFGTEPVFPGEEMVVLLPVGHALADRGVIRHGELADETLLVPPRASEPGVVEGLLSTLAADGGAPHAVRETAGTDVRDLILAVGDGLGIALSPPSFLRSIGDLGTVVTTAAVDPPLRMPETLLAWRAEPDPRLQPVVAAAGSAAGELRTRF